MIFILSLNIQEDGEIGCWVFIKTWFGCFHYYSYYESEQELKKIIAALDYTGVDFKEHFIKTLELEDIVKNINTMEG